MKKQYGLRKDDSKRYPYDIRKIKKDYEENEFTRRAHRDYRIRHGHDIEDDIYIKQADTIEELCDVFVITEHGTDKSFLIKDFEIVFNYFKDNAIIYGAVWCEKGIIFVARMNDKGELELI